MIIISILLAFVPGLLIAFFIWKKDIHNKEPRLHLGLSFLIGVLITVPVFFLEQFAMTSLVTEGNSFISLLLIAFVYVALVEEVFKGGALLLYPFRQASFDEPLDGIVYAVMIAMGFATAENLLYAIQHGFATTLVRAFTAVPAHAAFAIILGYFVGKAKFNPEKKWKYIGIGFGLAVLLHGFYDLFLTQIYYEWLIGLSIPVLIFSIYLALKMLKEQRKDSWDRKWLDEEEEEIDLL